LENSLLKAPYKYFSMTMTTTETRARKTEDDNKPAKRKKNAVTSDTQVVLNQP